MNVTGTITWILSADTIALIFGFALDALFGDPIGKWHPVCLIGGLIGRVEKGLRRSGDSEATQRRKGLLTVLIVTTATVLATAGILFGTVILSAVISSLTGRYMGVDTDSEGIVLRITGAVYLILAAILADTVIAAKDLKKESMRVYDTLTGQSGERLIAARRALSRIVGRDTEALEEEGVIRAAVETVAENTTDGVVSPLFYYMIGGPVFAMLYKAVNTMDSMLGYKNERYLHFGRTAAKLDDAANFLPARLAALLWIAASLLLRADAKGAWRIWRRDRFCHESPNSAQTESACAGSLGVELAGDAVYFGKRKEKPTIGDALRPAEAEDIRRANRLMYGTSLLMLLCTLAVRAGMIAICLMVSGMR